ncbi:pyridoxal phosphate-dependent decarboxylase family protein [Prochlorococcus marinus]|uniref:pyridoxal phosphate-dependent decarboxylase family protein n=1 Tax=Prochlorococcus marinus TaxID=1219 RepID=UPI0022B3F376|nr:pyridoxal-dependent decarboxylase [Prochlorococcus marinus]
MEFFASPYLTDQKIKSFLEESCTRLCDWFATTDQREISPRFSELPEIDPFDEGLAPNELLDDLQLIMNGSYQPSHPGALAHLDPPPLVGSIVGDLISAGLNNNLLAEELSPSLTKLERSLCRWFAGKLGLPKSAGGVSASGGSLANLMALLVARSQAKRLYDTEIVVMASIEAHVSISRAIKVMGLPPHALCQLPTDNEGKIIISSLEENLRKIQSEGKKCFAVVATAGTTVRGAIDPLAEISNFCAKEGIWLHVDAAIGGVFSLSTSTSHLLSNISKADSVVINPQKVLGITKTSSLLLVANKADLYACFSTGFPYIEPSSDNEAQGGELGLQGTRPAEVLKLWIGLRQLGQKGINDLLDGSLKRRLYFYEKINRQKFKVISGPLHLLAFTPSSIDDIHAKEWSMTTKSKLLKNKFMLSRPNYKNRYYLKAVMGNPHTTLTHIDELIGILNQCI